MDMLDVQDLNGYMSVFQGLSSEPVVTQCMPPRPHTRDASTCIESVNFSQTKGNQA